MPADALIIKKHGGKTKQKWAICTYEILGILMCPLPMKCSFNRLLLCRKRRKAKHPQFQSRRYTSSGLQNFDKLTGSPRFWTSSDARTTTTTVIRENSIPGVLLHRKSKKKHNLRGNVGVLWMYRLPRGFLPKQWACCHLDQAGSRG